MNQTILAGVDIGGSHITAALINPDTGAIIPSTWQRNAVHPGGTATAIIDGWSAVITACFAGQPSFPARLGIAMPGPFDYETGISLIKDQHKYDALYGLNVKELLAAKLSIAPQAITLTNDAACFLQGEVYAGAGKGFRYVVGITLGTGLGSAIYTNDKAIDAAWWNRPYKNGIAEDYLSSRWFVQRYHELTGQDIEGVKQLLNTPEEFIMQRIFDEFGINLGTFLAEAIGNRSIDQIVIGGNIAQAFGYFEQALNSSLQAAGIHSPVQPAILGEQAALIGAATAGLEIALPVHKQKTIGSPL
ncbi:ROK family protein [Paraflavitalea sp. CAU 1676]|uniref:ROK family protein n=1 Tax=Paraflavitalea sp. CAU 1676 TaxID=3032598 RepID=UPI0023DA0353|nr:ROK family protein [Paraflavitalea sp. CAU 1676]MDF2192325.1 ROK family protein [Paraflavitalea sp. CAU 1676]